MDANISGRLVKYGKVEPSIIGCNYNSIDIIVIINRNIL